VIGQDAMAGTRRLLFLTFRIPVVFIVLYRKRAAGAAFLKEILFVMLMLRSLFVPRGFSMFFLPDASLITCADKK
jgi:hypothetical protein